MFIPKSNKQWKPEHMRGKPRRRCYWCTIGPREVGALVQVLEGPMRFHFCSEECMHTWQQHRHDADVVTWFKTPTGTRAKIMKEGKCTLDLFN